MSLYARYAAGGRWMMRVHVQVFPMGMLFGFVGLVVFFSMWPLLILAHFTGLVSACLHLAMCLEPPALPLSIELRVRLRLEFTELYSGLFKLSLCRVVILCLDRNAEGFPCLSRTQLPVASCGPRSQKKECGSAVLSEQIRSQYCAWPVASFEPRWLGVGIGTALPVQKERTCRHRLVFHLAWCRSHSHYPLTP